jgi:NAD(P)-dependent dehydrogenase (short-subunit alcohol dehydrogenase family)
MKKTWLITGAGRGLGREFALAALGRGDQVALTARNLHLLEEMVNRFGDAVLPLQLDVIDRDAVFAAVASTKERFGNLDVVVNNAGYGLFGAIEEVTPEQVRAQLEVNVLGRDQGSGHIIQVSSIGGVVAFPLLGAYHASKWALEALSESLAQEVAGFGIKVTLVEPGSYETDWAGSSAVWADGRDEYRDLRERMISAAAGGSDPAGVGAAILAVVDQAPARVFFGTAAQPIAENVYQQRLATWRQTASIAALADRN